MKKTTHQTSINGKYIERVPDQNGEFIAMNSTGVDENLTVQFAPGVPTDPAKFREWVKAQNAKLNPEQS